MKRILITTGIFPPEIGGPASYAVHLGSRLAKQGIQVTVLTYAAMRSADSPEVPFRVVRVWKGLPKGIRHAVYCVRAWLLARQVDGILALNAVSAGVPAVMAARLAGKPLVVRIVGDYAWEIAVQTGHTFFMIDDFQKMPKTGRIGRLHRMQAWTCRKAAAVIVPSHYLEGLVKGWGIAPERLHVIYNGVHIPPLDMGKEEARKAIGVAGTVILSGGRLVAWKGFRMLIKLMPKLLQVNQFFRLVIVGDGPDMAMLRSVVRNLGLERKVFLVGRKSQKELALYLAAADMFVLNSGYEGFSHQVLEAMQAGIPVITTSVGGNREVVVQGTNGLLVRYNDEFNLIEAIKMVARNDELRERMIENARHTVAAFSVEKMYERTTALLTQTFS